MQLVLKRREWRCVQQLRGMTWSTLAEENTRIKTKYPMCIIGSCGIYPLEERYVRTFLSMLSASHSQSPLVLVLLLLSKEGGRLSTTRILVSLMGDSELIIEGIVTMNLGKK